MVLDRYSKLLMVLALCAVFSVANSEPGSTSANPHSESSGRKDLSDSFLSASTGKCISCHLEQELDIQLIDVEAGKCSRCHHDSLGDNSNQNSASRPASGFVKTAATSQEILQLNQKNKVPARKLPPNAGMRYPMYYRDTRLGDSPSTMVLIPAGEFVMGSNNRLPDEGPEHAVTLESYFIDVTEVTNLQYKKFNNETKRRSPTHFRNRTYPDGKADHPVTYVSWQDANAYCEWAGKRLPTDQEWEKAARGSDARIFPWGNEFDAEKANTPLRWQMIGNFGDTTPVAAFEKGVSPYGVYDMSGNVWEWTSSWYKPYPGNKVESESYGERYKTLKGGSWFDCSFYNCGISAPVFNRAFFSVRTKNDSFGFRCAKDAAE